MMCNSQCDNYKGDEKDVKNAQITLEGRGDLYQLDPHTGVVSTLQGQDNGDGTVTFTLNVLYGGDSMIYALSEHTDAFAKAVTAESKLTATNVEKALDLSEAAWNLVIDSYGPDADSEDPSVSKITTVDFGAVSLGKWKDIEASQETLETLGVESMQYVSCTGEYTTTFTKPEDWSESAGAVIAVDYGKDQIGDIIVNVVSIRRTMQATTWISEICWSMAKTRSRSSSTRACTAECTLKTADTLARISAWAAPSWARSSRILTTTVCSA